MSYDPFNTANTMFTIMPIMMILLFAVFIGMLIYAAAKGIGKWNYNNSQPVLTVPAKVISKRSKVDSRISYDNDIHDVNDINHTGDHHHHHTYTSYFVAFEVESGSRMEFQVDDSEYGLLAEDDAGKLTFQGSRYKGFERFS